MLRDKIEEIILESELGQMFRQQLINKKDEMCRTDLPMILATAITTFIEGLVPEKKELKLASKCDPLTYQSYELGFNKAVDQFNKNMG